MHFRPKDNRMNRKMGFSDEGIGILYKEKTNQLYIISWHEEGKPEIWCKIEEDIFNANFAIEDSDIHLIPMDLSDLVLKQYPVDFL